VAHNEFPIIKSDVITVTALSLANEGLEQSAGPLSNTV
jgi:hypothetical protein